MTNPDDQVQEPFSLANKTRLIGPRLVLPDAATGPAVDHGCALFFDHPSGKCFVELSAQECQELIAWLQGNHSNIRRPEGATLN